MDYETEIDTNVMKKKAYCEKLFQVIQASDELMQISEEMPSDL